MHQPVDAFDSSDELEQHARLAGLLAILRLPPVFGPNRVERVRVVEVEVSPDVWEELRALDMDDERITYYTRGSLTPCGTTFVRARDKTPRWRVDHGLRKTVIG